MNWTPEQMAAAHALLESLAPQAKFECWFIADRDGDLGARHFKKDAAEAELRRIRLSGSFHPYTLMHCVEVQG